MEVKIEPSWKTLLQEEFNKPYFEELVGFVKKEYAQGTVYPKAGNIFKAFNLCPFDKVKAVILGQDPYHEPNQAQGLCFSVPAGVRIPPSLVNIYKEIQSDIGTPPAAEGDLTRWASQGVLLLNATLTVQAHKAGSHQGKGWETFTDAVIKTISQKKQNVVFLLWGAYAIKKSALIDQSKHLVLTSPHPSPLSAHRGFFGNRHFSRTNAYLTSTGQQPIVW
ncbi:MAG: uracil-DNA glycosylase [Bacteroidales bacterium]|nr:uracil-DNA glycosylase [Bacteroidales bacterium]